METKLDVHRDVSLIQALLAVEQLEIVLIAIQHAEMVRRHQMNNVIMEINLDVLQDVSLILDLLAVEKMEPAQVVVQPVEME